MAGAEAVHIASLSHVAACLRREPRDLPCIIELVGHIRTSIGVFAAREQQGKRTGPRLSDFLTTAVSWVSAPRSSEEFQEIVQLSCTCSLAERRTSAHVAGQRAFVHSQHRRPAVMFAEQLLGTMLISLVHGKKQGGGAQQIPRRKFWPTRLEQLLPHGPEDTTRGMTRWLRADWGGAHPEKFVQEMFLFFEASHPLSLPYFVTSHAFIPDGIKALMKHALDLAEKNRNNLTSSVVQQVTSMLATASRVTVDIFLIWMDDTLRRSMFTAVSATELMMASYQCYHTGCLLEDSSFADHTEITQTKQTFGILGALMLHDHPAIRKAAPDYIVEAFDYCWHITPWERTLSLAKYLSSTNRCSAPDCMHSRSDAGPFKRCGGCQRVIYCSEACQIDAWDHPDVPHKSICKTLRRACPLEMLPNKYSDLRSLSNNNPPDNLDAELVQEVLDHFKEVAEYQMEWLRTWS
jgi:hypothetical protein